MTASNKRTKGFCGAMLMLLSLLACGCSVVRVDVATPSATHAETRRLVRENGDNRAAKLLLQGSHAGMQTPEKISALVEAARLTQNAKPGTAGQALNRGATAQIVRLMQAQHFAPVSLADGQTLGVAAGGKKTLDPRTADELLVASSIRIEKLRERVVQDGAGVPCVVRFVPASPALRGQPGIPPLTGICEPVTALVRFQRGAPQLVFYRTLKDDEAVVDGRMTKLAADFTAPLAYMVSKGQNRIMAIREMLRTDLNIDRAGLYQFSVYDPDKIPVVFVHGLMSRPETWVPAVNQLLADKQIRERYQFWFFLYPTGLPVWASAAKLRGELERYRAALDPPHTNPAFSRMVLAGHSMGGLISGLQIRTGGKHLWQQFLNTPPEKMNLSPRLKAHLIRIIEFQPRPEIARVVFFATPHRGSDLAVNPFADFFSRLVRLPFGFLHEDVKGLKHFLHEDVRELFVAPANSIVFLRARSPLLAAIMKLPMRESVPFHSIIGDRGRGDTPESSDGVVPYWSSHLEGAESEKIVPSGHGTNENSEGVEEFRRILRLHLNRS